MPESPELQRAVELLTTSINELRAELVRKDVYEANERTRDTSMSNLTEDVKELAARTDKQEEKRAADRRLVMTSLAIPVLLIFLQIYLASRVGGTS